MTDHVARLYVAAASLLGFFVAWAGIAAQPWRSSPPPANDSAAVQLAAYEQRLRADAALLERLRAPVSSRATAPLVRVVTVPPVTTTRTS